MSQNSKEDTSPATKADIAALLNRFDDADKRFDAVDKRFDAVDRRFATKADLEDLRKATQVDLEDVRGELLREIRAEAQETRRHFDVVAEKMLHDFRGAFGDRTSQHDDQLQSHEHRLGAIERQLELAV